jgi:hypothetical protein
LGEGLEYIHLKKDTDSGYTILSTGGFGPRDKLEDDARNFAANLGANIQVTELN